MVNTTVHTEWHMRLESGHPVSPVEAITEGALEDKELWLLREALGEDPEH